MAKKPSSIYEELYKQYSIARKQDKSIETALVWFYREIRALYGMKPVPFPVAIDGATKIAPEDMGIGRMYLFEYRASRAEDYYDRFPVVFPFRVTATMIYGFNLHYLPTKYRLIAMGELLERTSPMFPPKTGAHTKLDYGSINGGLLNFMRVSVRAYKLRRIRSAVGEIPTTGWITAAMLPVARFKGTLNTTNAVSTEMLKQIRNL